jgi:hypothetical protein
MTFPLGPFRIKLADGAMAVHVAARRNGFSLPLHWMQVLAGSAFVTLVGLFYAILHAAASGTVQRGLGAAHLAAALATLALALKVSQVDPRDTRDYSAFPQPGSRAPGSRREGLWYCHCCQDYVEPTSKHCRVCDKCVQGFDHHCKWLNNCIGSKNYAAFVALLVATVVLLALEALLALAALIAHAQGDQKLMRPAGDTGGSVALVSVYMVVTGATLLAVLRLLFFHVKLLWRKQTTYDHVMSENKRRRAEHAPNKRNSVGADDAMAVPRLTAVLPVMHAQMLSQQPQAPPLPPPPPQQPQQREIEQLEQERRQTDKQLSAVDREEDDIASLHAVGLA